MPTRMFGRRYAPDARDFKLSAILPAAPSPRTFRYWNANSWWGNQGSTPQCVAYAWLHYLEDGPVLQAKKPHPIVKPADLYHEAQVLDEWPGEDYDGTSIRGGVKAVVARGFVGAYHFTTSVDELVQALLEVGPLVIGVNWYESMMKTDKSGRLNISGSIVGGHAIKVDGVNTKTALFRLKNSWGRSWGHGGFCYLSLVDMERLLSEEGEGCISTEVKK